MALGGEQDFGTVDVQKDLEQSSEQDTTTDSQVKESNVQVDTEPNTQKYLDDQVRTSQAITEQQTTPVQDEKEQEATDPKSNVVEELKTSKVYDLVIDQNNNSYVKMPSIKFNQHGGQQNVTRWLETNKIANININNWREDTDNQGELKKWIYNSTDRPEIPQGVNIEEEGITDEDMAEILSPTAHEEAKEKDEKTITTVQEEEYIDPKILESVHKANVYDSVLDKDGNNFVKMPQILTDEHGGEKHISAWVNIRNLGNIHIDNWQQDTNSENPVRKWIYNDTERPELTDNLANIGISDEEMAKNLSTREDQEETVQQEKEEIPQPDEEKLEIQEEESEKEEDNIQDTDEKEPNQDEIMRRANEFTSVPQEEQQEVRETAKSENGYIATIKRMFSGQKWKGLVSQIGISVAGSLAAVKGTGLAVAAFGPAGAIGVGAVMVGLGGYTAYKTYEGVKKAAKEQGMTMSEFIKEKGFLKGVATGIAVSGVLKVGGGMVLPALVPGVGPVLPVAMVLASTAAEIGLTAKLESDTNKEQENFRTSLMNSYEYRRYNKLENQGYVIREGIDVSKVISDINNPNLSPDEIKTAQKTGIAVLRYLYEKTNDEKYRFLHYTQKDSKGNDVRREVDITKIGLTETPDSTDEYPMEELIGINIESFIDTLDNNELITLTTEAWNNSAGQDRTDLAREVISRFVGLEAADVENLLSKEKETYFESVKFMLGNRVGMTAVNVGLTTVAAGRLIHSGISQIGNQSQSIENQIQEQYRNNLDNENATVTQYTDSSGREVNIIDIDGDGTHDLVHVPGTNEYYARSNIGAEKLFEMQNPNIGNVSVSQFETSNTGITGTIVGEGGQVLGIVHTDNTGNIAIMNEAQLSNTLRATLTDGSPAPISISQIQGNGNASIEINGVSHNVNLAELGSIPPGGSMNIIEGTPGVGTINVEPGDSVPRLLDRILAVAKEHNPNMQGERHELQNFLYRDGGGQPVNDANIRTELGLNNPVQPAEQFEIADSPTIMGWLQQLNNGQPVNLPGGSPRQVISDMTHGINFDFNASIDSIDLNSLQILTPPVETIAGPTVEQSLGVLASLGAAALCPPTQGKIVRETIWSMSEFKPEVPKPEPIDPILEEYTRKILETQVFGRDYTGERFKLTPNGEIFKMGDHTFTLGNMTWIMDNEPVNVEELVDTLLSQDEKTRVEVLTKILDNISSGDGQRGRRRINLFPQGNNGGFQKQQSGIRENSTWIEWGTLRDRNNLEVINSKTLALRILRIREDETGSLEGNIPIGEQIISQQQANVEVTSEKIETLEILDSTKAEEILGRTIIEGDPYKGKVLTTDILREKGLAPRYKIDMGDSVVWLSSSAYNLGGDRIAVVAYVEKDGEIFARSYWLSNSQAVWRLLPSYTLENDQINWYGKGWDEESIFLPVPIQKVLSEITKDENSVLNIDEPDFIFAGTTRVGTLAGILSNNEQDKFPFYKEVNMNPRKLSGLRYEADSSKKIPPKELILTTEESPNFTNLLGSWTQKTNMYGEISVEVYESNDKTLNYLLCKDIRGRVWIGGIQEIGEMTSTGLQKNWVLGGDLTTPAFEYGGRQTGGYGNDKISYGSYVDMFENYISKIPVIQEYLRISQGDSTVTNIPEIPRPQTNLESITDYRPFVEDIVRRHVRIENNDIQVTKVGLERFIKRAQEELEKQNIPLDYDSLINELTTQLERRIKNNKERLDQLGQSQGIEIEVLKPITSTYRRDNNYPEWVDRYGGRGYQPRESSRTDYDKTRNFGIPEDENERRYQTYEMSPNPSLSATEMGSIVSMLTYADFLDKEAIDLANERNLYSLHISTSFPTEITNNPLFEKTYSRLASILTLGFASIQMIGYEGFKIGSGGKIVAVKGLVDEASITRDRQRTSTAINPITEEQRREMEEGRLTITEMRGFDVNERTASLLINKNYIDTAVRMSFEGNPEAQSIMKNFVRDAIVYINQELELDTNESIEYINNPQNTQFIADKLVQRTPEEIAEFRKGLGKIVRGVRRNMIDIELIPEYL
jgi:hypothetical protein